MCKDLLDIRSELLVEVVTKSTEILNTQDAPIISELEKKLVNLKLRYVTLREKIKIKLDNKTGGYNYE